MAKNPTRYESPSGKVAVKLDMLPGDMALVAGVSPEDTKGVMVFEYTADETVSIIGTRPKEEIVRLLQNALTILVAIPAQDIPS